MKRTASGILLLFIGSIFIQGQLQNPDFETTENSLPSGWDCKASDLYDIKTDPTIQYSGQNSLLIASKAADASGNMLLFSQTFPAPGKGLRRIRLSGFIKSENVKDEILLWAHIINTGKKIISKGNSQNQSNPVTLNADWKEYSLEFIIDDQAKDITFGGYLSGNGKVWFDHFSVSEVPFSDKASSKQALSYIDDFKSIVKKNSIFKEKINWNDLNSNLQKISKGMETLEDTYPAIQYIMNTLREAGDNHSFIDSKETAAQKSTSNPVGKEPEARLLEEKIGYIMVPAFGSLNKEVGNEFALKIQNMIRKLDTENNLKGWIVDLRNNMGGNMYPMIVGLGPLTGEGELGYFKDNKSKQSWKYEKGKSSVTSVTAPYILKKNDLKIAVLIGPNTASSGEIAAISFIGKPNAKTFGQPSAGYTSGNRLFVLKDRRNLLLATSYEMDRTGKEYIENIQPDVMIQPSENKDSDPDIPVASKWILE
ncbi:MAG: S41 family peptidase [Chryseobacterium sp.]|jgi:hypothetical protein|uniref:S41 family peptidase n=1 Tax=Chryseobacterium sp. TaxID=1871047 RepID=UPI002828FD0A|nr:S41 family peptidase [Chryseobacterium sp.]MDR2235800.1 S41 family peptidase [Chryseobacterium sp.]